MPKFFENTNWSIQKGRLGLLKIGSQDVATPNLYPVSFFMTGTTARGGATWKHILHQDDNGHDLCLLPKQIPVLSQVLHFLDYRVSPQNVRTVWRQKTIRGLYNEQAEALQKNHYTAPIFLDSGGFKLMWRTGLDLSAYGIALEEGEEAKSILALQRDLGGDIVATLDYPLPPNLDPQEAIQRMTRSRQNAVQAAELLQNDPEFAEYNPFLYMAVHGLTPQAITGYVTQLFTDLEAKGLNKYPFGLAIGSLVPLRSSHKTDEMMGLVQAAVAAIPEEYRGRTPIHVFGATGLMIPFLAYCGVDTFDSSTFAQEARSLKYLIPSTHQRRNVLEMTARDFAQCDCSICQHLQKNENLQNLQGALVSDVKGEPINGRFKSAYYADIALHNLELDFKIVDKTKEAIGQDSLTDYLIEMARTIPRTAEMLAAVAKTDEALQRKVSQSTLPAPRKRRIAEPPAPYKSLSYTPQHFNINANGYQPHGHKRVLLIIPCSSTKPYSASFSHTHLFRAITEVFPTWPEHIDKVTLSGLYGPVPLCKEQDAAVLHYDFKLTTSNQAQMDLCVERLTQFLEKHGRHYDHCLAYGTSGAYRRVFEQVAGQKKSLVVFPQTLKARTSKAYFHKTNISELIAYLQGVLDDDQ